METLKHKREKMQVVKKIVTLVVLLVTLQSCFSQESKEFYKEIDNGLVKKYYSEYEIKIPNNWFSYSTDPGLVAHSPNEFKNEISPEITAVSFIVRKNIYKRKTAKKSMKSMIKFYKSIFPNFKYELKEFEHKRYGKFYTLKFAKNKNRGKEIVFAAVIHWKNNTYIHFYTSLEKYYEKYLDDAVRMINSFKVR
ncbi:MAG: hypothetical protein HWD85_04840 [Flavobacteriaceae bacterium]|nr:hypothetical protein [Flavobacteriaceae bacterium]